MGDRFTVPAGGILRWGDGETRRQEEMGKLSIYQCPMPNAQCPN